jgi:hypothetical protein
LDVLLPSVAVEWIAIERFMLALVAVAVVVPRSGAKAAKLQQHPALEIELESFVL